MRSYDLAIRAAVLRIRGTEKLNEDLAAGRDVALMIAWGVSLGVSLGSTIDPARSILVIEVDSALLNTAVGDVPERAGMLQAQRPSHFRRGEKQVKPRIGDRCWLGKPSTKSFARLRVSQITHSQIKV